MSENKTRIELEINITNKYPGFINRISDLENQCIGIMNKLFLKHENWAKDNDVRLGAFGRILTNLNTTKTSLILLKNYLSQPNWEEEYFGSILPEKLQLNGKYYGYFRSIDSGYRFQFYQQLYSQFETTARIICRSCNLKDKKPITQICKHTNFYDKDFIDFCDYIRNSIHNNGFYFPLDYQPSNWPYSFNNKTISFINGQKIDVDWNDFFELTNKIIELLYNVLSSSVFPENVIIKDTTDE
jgi:hypothetical protein